ncbi:MAG TPA: ATP-grasp domain-containing protein [Gammaproteobacteria bacterium]|nr:ATP-grasp domain-containing protein [Gammaproteobacteria bacterium]
MECLVVSQGEHALVNQLDQGMHVDFSDPDLAIQKIRKRLQQTPVQGVIGTDDTTIEIAAQLAARLGLRHNTPAAARLSRRKDLARQQLQQANLPLPDTWLIDRQQPLADQISPVRFPCVAKPLSLSGSRGVIRADNPTSLQQTLLRIGKILDQEGLADEYERQHILIESFLPGPEVAFEGLLSNGELRALALFDKPDPLDGPFFEETYYITPSRHPPELMEKVRQRVDQACQAYGLREGSVHAECRLADGDAWILELASRTIGGQCARLIQFATGRSLESLILSHASGLPSEQVSISGAAGVLMIPIEQTGILRRVEGIAEALKVTGIVDLEISVQQGYELIPLPEGASYLGFIFARAETAQQVEQALRTAFASLKIVTAPVLAVQPL